MSTSIGVQETHSIGVTSLMSLSWCSSWTAAPTAWAVGVMNSAGGFPNAVRWYSHSR